MYILINLSIPPFQDYFIKSDKTLNIKTLDMPNKTLSFSPKWNAVDSIKPLQHWAATIWNKLQNEINHDVLQDLQSKTKELFTNKILTSYILVFCISETQN